MNRDPELTQMLVEAREAPERIAQQGLRNRLTVAKLADHLKSLDPPLVVTLARGSSNHAATYGKYLIETRLGCPVGSFAPAVVSVYGTQLRLRGTVVFAISQSGQSPDLVEAAEAARLGGAFVVAIVNDESSPLASAAQALIPMSAGPEKSVAATKSCLASMAALYDITSAWRGDEEMKASLAALPDAMTQAVDCDWSAATPAFMKTLQAIVVGRGLGLGAAHEAALKLKETSQIQAEAFSAAEVRHGPMAVVNQGYPVLGSLSLDAGDQSVLDVLGEFAGRRAQAFLASPSAKDVPEGVTVLRTPLAPEPGLQPLVMLQAFYKFASNLAVSRGLDPDHPPHLRKVTKTV